MRDIFYERLSFFQNRSNESTSVDFVATILLDAAGAAHFRVTAEASAEEDETSSEADEKKDEDA